MDIGDIFWPTSIYQRIMLCVLGLFGSLTMLTSFACVKFMPVSDAITLIFTAPLFTMVIAAMFMRERITVIKAIAGKFTEVKWQPRYVFTKINVT